MRLVLVRHGQTASNRSHALDTAYPGVPLDPRGREQAEALAGDWDSLVGAAPNAMRVSPLLRCRMTAAPLAARFGVDAVIRSGVRELHAGDLEMNSDFPSMLRYMRALEAWTTGDLDYRMPGGGDGHAVHARALPVVDEVVAAARAAREAAGGEPEDAVAVIVAHGAMNRILSEHLAENIPSRLVMSHPLGNAHTVVLERSFADGADAAAAAHVPSGRGTWHAHTWNNKPVDFWDLSGASGFPAPSKLEA